MENQIDPTYTGPRLFGAPVGDFSIGQTLVFIFASTVATFLAGSFVGIATLLTVMAVSHHKVDFSIAYKFVGLPLGVLMLLVSSVYLGSLLMRRLLRK